MARSLEELLKTHPSLEFVLDGQTQVMEDLRFVSEELYERLLRFVEEGRLKVGPVYAQIDWRISIPQAVWMDFEIGRMDCERMGGCFKYGWFMDNFGHISQLPQIMRIFGIEGAVIWRGVRHTFPAFSWRSPDGSTVPVVSLVGGYRTLYNLSDTSEIAEDRLRKQLEKLGRLGKPVVLTDGYDLDVHPEDPSDFLKEDVDTKVEDVFEELSSLPVVEGELLSGKIASVFPGTLSTRTYLKISADHVGKVLTTLDFTSSYLGLGRPIPLWRDYLKTLIHDNVCGVGIDQIHEEMVEEYRRILLSSAEALEELTRRFDLSGLHVFSPSEFEGAFSSWKGIFKVKAEGVGFWKVEEIGLKESSGDFEPFKVLIERELGDAYSSYTEPMEWKEWIRRRGVWEAEGVKRFVFERVLEGEGIELRILETYDVFEDYVWLTAVLDPRGCCYKLYYVFDRGEDLRVGMPFDVVERECTDEDLLPEDETLGGILLAAREVGKIEEFPLQDFIITSGKTIVVKGMRSYVCREERILIPVVRSVEWITREVKGRTGDAGPKMYVPGARCERRITVQMGTIEGEDEEKARFLAWPKIFVRSKGGSRENVKMFESGFILPGLRLRGRRIEKLSFNPVEFNGNSRTLVMAEPLPVGEDRSRPSRRVLNEIRREISSIEERLSELERSMKGKISLEHEYWTLKRRKLELELSLKLNESRLSEDDLKNITFELNEVRRKKRTYDYLLEMEGRS